MQVSQLRDVSEVLSYCLGTVVADAIIAEIQVNQVRCVSEILD